MRIANDEKNIRLGPAEVDQLREEVVRTVKTMLKACSSGEGLAMAAETVGKLSQLLPALFKLEERLMIRSGCQDLEAHQKSHLNMTGLLSGLRAQLAKEGVTTLLAIQLNHFMTLVLMVHFSSHDRGLRKMMEKIAGLPYASAGSLTTPFMAG